VCRWKTLAASYQFQLSIFLPNIRSAKRNLKISLLLSGPVSSRVETTMSNILSGNPGPSHLVVVKSLNTGKQQLRPPLHGYTTYWPSDMNKIPDLVDFCVTKGIPPDFAIAQSCLDISSDYSSILVTLTSSTIHHDPPRASATDVLIGITSATSSTTDSFCKFPLSHLLTSKQRFSSLLIRFNRLAGRRHLHSPLLLESTAVLSSLSRN
jgi:hypothetical protein